MVKPGRKAAAAGIILLLVVITVIGACVVYFHFCAGKNEDAKGSGVVGVISDDWDPGVGAEEPPQGAGIQIPGYSTARMAAGDTSLHLSIGNPEKNNCGFYATLMLADGTILYKSDLLNPGYGLTEVPLSETLEKGEYDAFVLYECVTLDETHSPLNSAESEFKLIVE